MTSPRRGAWFIVGLVSGLACGPKPPPELVGTGTTDDGDATGGVATAEPPATASTTGVATAEGTSTGSGAVTGEPPADLPAEPPGDPKFYGGDAPGCGDGVPEAGVYCFERIKLADRRWIPGIADFDGDGHLDVLWQRYEGLFLQRGTGDGGLLPGEWQSEQWDDKYDYSRLLVGDVDQDGDVDVVRDFAGLHVWLNDGQGSFTAGSTIVPDKQWFDFATLVDLDLDGQLELVAAEDDGAPALSVFQFDGASATRVFSWPILGCDLNGLAHARLDPDPLPDLVAVGRLCDEMPGVTTPVVPLKNSGGLAFAEGSHVPVDDQQVGELAAGDYDADGLVDVAAAAFFDGDIRVLRGLGDGGFAPPVKVGPAQPWAVEPWAITRAELDGAPGDELGYTVYRTDPNTFDYEVTLAVLLDPADPAGELLWIDSCLHGLWGADFNEDGITDLIYTHYSYDPVEDQTLNDLTLLLSNP